MGYTPTVATASMIAIDKTHPYWKSRNYYRSRPSLKNIRLPFSRYWMEGSGSGDVGQDIYRPAMAAALQGRPKTGFTRVSTPGRDEVSGEFSQDSRNNSTRTSPSNRTSQGSSNQRGG